VDAIRPFLGYHGFFQRNPEFDSNYNSLQVSLNRHLSKLSKGLTFGISYTWSKNLTDNVADRGNPIYNTYDFRQDYGPASLNTPHVFIANYVYDLPFFKDQKGLIGHILGGWEISGITTVDSGQSLSLRQNTDPFRAEDFSSAPGTYSGGIGIDFDNIVPRPDVVPGVSITGAGNVNQYFNTRELTDAIGHFGTSGPGVILGPGRQNWDISRIRNIKIGERFSLQFRGEFFNVFNQVNFNTVDTNVDSATYGRLTGDHLPRNIQLGLKLYF
jgi:hypothetical protein